jgi:signal transduction histidine kinase
MGLNICQRIVKAHGGILLLESEIFKGTSFTLKIVLRKLN